MDTGLLRKDEATQVTTLFREHYNIPLIHVDASKAFLGELARISDPEIRRLSMPIAGRGDLLAWKAVRCGYRGGPSTGAD